MALTNGNNNNNGKLKILTLRAQDKNKVDIPVHFEVSEKIDDKWQVTGKFTAFSGRLRRITPKVKEFKKDGKVIDSKDVVDLFVDDGDETYMVTLTYKVATRRLFNSLLNLTSFDNIEISANRDKNQFECIWLRQDGVNVKGKFSKEEIPAVDEAKVGKTLVRSYDSANTFFKDHLTELAEIVAKAPKKETPVAKSDYKEIETEESEEIPF